MIHITFKDYKSEASMLRALVEELRLSKQSLQNEANINRARLGDAKAQHEYDSDQIRDLKLKVSDLQDRITDLQERLEKEQSDNCELQNIYAAKCKECDSLGNKLQLAHEQLDKLTQEKADLEEKLSRFGSEKGYVVVEEEYLSQLKADAERFRAYTEH